MKKRSARSKLKGQLEATVKEIVKIRDNYICQWCGVRLQKQNCHASHIVPVSQSLRLAYDPLNLKVLCFHCHLQKWHLNPIEASQWFQHKFPDRWEYLEKQKQLIEPVKLHDLQSWLVQLQQQLKELHGQT